MRNLRTVLDGLEIVRVGSLTGRIEITLGVRTSWIDVRDRVSRIFGIANFSYAGRAPHDFHVLASAILADLGDCQPESFVVRVRRTDKRFPLTSPQIEREVGGLVKQATGWRVDLDEPALSISIEMLPEDAFYFSARSRVPAGCRPAPEVGWRVCCRGVSTRRLPRTG